MLISLKQYVDSKAKNISCTLTEEFHVLSVTIP